MLIISAVQKALEQLPDICEKLKLDKEHIEKAFIFDIKPNEIGGFGPEYGRDKYLRIRIGNIHLGCEYNIFFNIKGEFTSIDRE